MIKNYLQLNDDEKVKVCNFINRKAKDNRSLEDIEKDIKTEIYDYGNGVLFYIKDNEVLGKASIVLEVAEIMNTVYIHFIDVLETADNKEIVLKKLIKQGQVLATEYNVTKVLLGIRDEDILKVAESIGLYSTYASYNMILEDKSMKDEVLDLVNISKENLDEYIELYNKSFMDMPHGTYIDEKEAEGYLNKADNSNGYFMVAIDGVNVGFMNATIENNEGFFDIGLCKEYRGKGYGKRLLETAIEYLKKNNVEKICLTVIEKNSLAYEMYKKRGFKVYQKLSSWIVLS